MKFRAVVKKTGEWWIGWLADLPGVNGQERTKEELLESLRIGAEEMLRADVEMPSDGHMELVEVTQVEPST